MIRPCCLIQLSLFEIGIFIDGTFWEVVTHADTTKTRDINIRKKLGFFSYVCLLEARSKPPDQDGFEFGKDFGNERLRSTLLFLNN